MVVGLDGIERIIETINPETNKFDTYTCGGYYNPTVNMNKPLSLVDWYRPTSGLGNHHSREYLKLLHEKDARPYRERVKGQVDE